MLKVFIREAKVAATLAKYPMVALDRRNSFPVNEATAIRLSGTPWGKSLLWFAKNDLDLHQNTSQVVDVVDIKNSKGNYITDADGNTMLDLCSAELNPVGYNHDVFKSLISSADVDAALINHYSATTTASAGYGELVKETMEKVAPASGLGVTLVDA